MKPLRPAKRQTMPELQLQEVGTEVSYEILLKASQSLPNEELNLLWQDLSYYTQTGLVGIHMSRLLVLLQTNASSKAAQEQCFALVASGTVSPQTLQAENAAA